MAETANGRGRRRLVADKRARTATTRSRGKARKVTTRARRTRQRGLLYWLTWPFRMLLWLVWALVWRATVAVAAIFAAATLYFYSTLPEDPHVLADGRVRGSVTMLDRDGAIFAWRGEQFGGPVDVGEVSPHLINAVVATEDRRFFWHLGISIRGTARAMVVNMRERGHPFRGQGGSTITQQVAKLLCLGVPYDPDTWESEADYEADCRRTTLWRKITEMPYAVALELRYSKDDILGIYFSRAYLGAGAHGFEAASQRYFGHGADAVDPAEAAMLAGLLVAPSYYAPTRNLQRARERAAVVVGLMEEQGYLSAAEAAAAREAPARLSRAAEARAGGYFADWIMREAPDFLSSETTEDVVIRTTFDADIQAAAEEAMDVVFRDFVSASSEAQAAVVIMSADGAVRAMVGGRETEGAGLFNRATQAVRQPGSAFKPFVYAAALDLGYRFDDLVLDGPLTLSVPGSGSYSPRNFDGNFYGAVTLTEALRRSLNTAAVRLSEEVGREAVRTVAAEFGIGSRLVDGPSVALGASEATLIEMTGAYAGILNGGSAVLPYGMVEVRIDGGEVVVRQQGGIQERVIREEAARQLTYMLSRVVEAGTGRRARLEGRAAAGKTGTTDSYRDAWFVGFTADYVAGVWMGYDDNTPLTGVTGGGLPAEIWRQTMERVHRGLPARPLPMIDPARAARPAPPPAPPPAEAVRTIEAESPAPAEQPVRPDLGTQIRDLLRSIGGN